MTTLAVEFAFDRRSMALEHQGKVQEVVHSGGRHTPALAMIDQVLHQSGAERRDIERWVVGIGPGSYTGVRLAISLAQGWQMARNTPCVGWSSFEGLARSAQRLGLPRLTLAVDAQREEMAVATVEWTPMGHRWLTTIHLVSTTELRRRSMEGEQMAGPDMPGSFGFGLDLEPSAVDLLASLDSAAVPIPSEELAPCYLREASFVKAPPARNWMDAFPKNSGSSRLNPD